ncbi:MAG TPA: polysaccharide deacetylase family protein [Methylomirabilota bacterium]|nr:polysaccharide deacetylase family protein [Methylomirabilota bacterium]
MRPASRAFLSSAGLALSRLGRLGRARGFRILYYHSISDAPVRSSVSPAAFEGQIEHLVRRGYQLLSLSEATRRVASGGPLAPQSLVLTLDDGFRDNYEHAFPVLMRFRVPATVFLTVAYIGTDRLPTLTRTEFVPRPLSWEQVKEMHAHGIEFGSHTLTHPMLSQISPDAARREIVQSRRVIEDKLGSPARLFCYPRGDFNATVKRIVGEEGYVAACTTRPGVNDGRTDPYALRRTYVSRQDTPTEFAKKVAGGYDLLQEAARRWQLLRRR